LRSQPKPAFSIAGADAIVAAADTVCISDPPLYFRALSRERALPKPLFECLVGRRVPPAETRTLAGDTNFTDDQQVVTWQYDKF
jgi:hypothetical protein